MPGVRRYFPLPLATSCAKRVGSSAASGPSWATRRPGPCLRPRMRSARNSFFSECRRRRREVPDVDGRIAEALEMRPEQGIRLELGQVMEAVGGLSPTHRSAISLVALSGNSYVEAAKASGCAVGTMKSRTYRARTRLFESLNHRCDRRSSDKQSSYP